MSKGVKGRTEKRAIAAKLKALVPTHGIWELSFENYVAHWYATLMGPDGSYHDVKWVPTKADAKILWGEWWEGNWYAEMTAYKFGTQAQAIKQTVKFWSNLTMVDTKLDKLILVPVCGYQMTGKYLAGNGSIRRTNETVLRPQRVTKLAEIVRQVNSLRRSD